jgi:hypothetical protein
MTAPPAPVGALVWDSVGDRTYEAGVDKGVLYLPDDAGVYGRGYAWYADNIKYLNLFSAEEFGGTIAAFTYPDEFMECDGTAVPEPGVFLGQQGRRAFGLSYRTRVGNDVDGIDHGYKLHLVYGATASPSAKAYGTINDSPAALEFSWDFTCLKVAVGRVNGVDYRPVANLVIDSTKVAPADLAALEDELYGTAATAPSLPLPAEVIAMFAPAGP